MHLRAAMVLVVALNWGSRASAVDLGLGLGLGLGDRGVGVDVSAGAGGSGIGIGMDLSLGDRSSGPDTSGPSGDSAAGGSTGSVGNGPDLGLAERLDLPDAVLGEGPDPVETLASSAVVTALAEANGESRAALLYRCADIVDQAERYEVSLVALCGILQVMAVRRASLRNTHRRMNGNCCVGARR